VELLARAARRRFAPGRGDRPAEPADVRHAHSCCVPLRALRSLRSCS